MQWGNRKMRIVARSGRMLANSLRGLSDNGGVSGLLVSDLTRAEAAEGICGWCANEPLQLVGMELISSTAMAGRTRLLIASVSLPLCQDCFGEFTSNLKMTVG